MKRSSSELLPSDIDSPTPPSSPLDEEPKVHQTTPSTPKKIKTTTRSGHGDTPIGTPEKDRSTLRGGGTNGAWTPDKREKFMERIIGLGLKTANMDDLASEFAVSKLQLRNATQAGRKNNLRDKACKAVRGE